MRRELVFDLETKTAPRGWGSREELHTLGISVVGVWASDTDQFRVFREESFRELEAAFSGADRIIGFAIKQFDIPVLQPHLSIDLSEIPALDIFEEVTKALGHRVSLKSLAKATLGGEKLGHGLEAVEWYKKRDWARLEEYCLQDVRLTRDLYRYGRERGHLLFESYRDGKIASVPVQWGIADVEGIRALVRQAKDLGRALEIDYVSREDSGGGFLKTRRIEIQAVRGDEVDAYDHLRKEVRMFRVGRIIGARLLEESAAPRLVPQSLFP